MPRQGLKTALQGLVCLSLWDDKDKAFSWRIGPQAQIVEKSIGINDLKEASGHIAIASGQEYFPFCCSKLSLEVFNAWVCWPTQSMNAHLDHHLSNVIKHPKNSASRCPYRP